MVALRLPVWSTLSSTPVTVTVCAMFQLDEVKVNVVGLTVAAAPSGMAATNLTFAVGWLVSATM